MLSCMHVPPKSVLLRTLFAVGPVGSHAVALLLLHCAQLFEAQSGFTWQPACKGFMHVRRGDTCLLQAIMATSNDATGAILPNSLPVADGKAACQHAMRYSSQGSGCLQAVQVWMEDPHRERHIAAWAE